MNTHSVQIHPRRHPHYKQKITCMTNKNNLYDKTNQKQNNLYDKTKNNLYDIHAKHIHTFFIYQTQISKFK